MSVCVKLRDKSNIIFYYESTALPIEQQAREWYNCTLGTAAKEFEVAKYYINALYLAGIASAKDYDNLINRLHCKVLESLRPIPQS